MTFIGNLRSSAVWPSMVEPSFRKFLGVFDPLNVFHGPHVNGLIEAVPMVWVSIFLILASVSVVFGRSSVFEGHHVNERLKTVKIGMAIDFMILTSVSVVMASLAFGRTRRPISNPKRPLRPPKSQNRFFRVMTSLSVATTHNEM